MNARLLTSLLLVPLGCAASNPQLDQRLATIEQRVDALERRSAAPSVSVAPVASAAPAKVWSCAANCLTSYSCTEKGESDLKWKALQGTGLTAAEAFGLLESQCSKTVYIEGRCIGGEFKRTQATIVNACVRN